MGGLKIAFYTDTYLPSMDGVVTSILNFKEELERRGHKVYIFAAGDKESKKKYSKKDVFIYQGVEFTPYPQYNVALFPYNSIFKLNDLDVDLIHVQTPMVMGIAGLMAGKVLRRPVVSSFHTIVTNKPIVDAYYPKNKHLKLLAKKSMSRYLKFFYNRCNAVIAPTQTIGKMLSSYKITDVKVVPNSIDIKTLNPKADGSAVRKLAGFNSSNRVILYLGRLSREKKIEVLLKAASMLMKKDSSIRLLVGGSGPAEQHYKSIASSLGIMDNTTFLGFVDQKVLAQVYAAADVVCLPSTFETQGIVLIEAMAVGKPVVGADYLAIKEMIHNGKNGEKFKPGDYTSCAKKIEKVLNNPAHYRSNAVRTAKEFSRERVTDRLLDVYNLVLSNRAI
ncbi:MAG: glycosyltransferase [Candidatus Micrarchaeota archaeon]|nr:glycosyltransferase [Candidatus Micrarchaeota archaeon]MDE1859146.1 glycosyltransferase [Candidatus Micrarchaeota archaeon]